MKAIRKLQKTGHLPPNPDFFRDYAKHGQYQDVRYQPKHVIIYSLCFSVSLFLRFACSLDFSSYFIVHLNIYEYFIFIKPFFCLSIHSFFQLLHLFVNSFVFR